MRARLKEASRGLFASGEAEDADEGGVEALLERVDSGSSAEDRRAALGELKALLASSAPAQAAVGHIGLHVLLAVLRDDRDDTDLLRGAVEALLQASTASASSENSAHAAAPWRVNAELLSRDPRATAVLLVLLDEQDTYVRYHTMQLLAVLLSTNAGAVQAAVLADPLGVSRLMDMLEEQEVVRIETLPLLTALASGREEVQKLLAFEGIFDRLLAIVRQEGGLDGGVVVQDGLELLCALLRGCAANQRLFRESGLLAALPPLLEQRSSGAAMLSRQAAACVLCCLDAIQLLLSPLPSDSALVAGLSKCQTALLSAGVLPPLLDLGLGGRTRFTAVRSSAMRTAALLVDGCNVGRDALARATVDVEGEGAAPQPAVLAALGCALRTNTQHGENEAAEALVAAYCSDNVEGQHLLASTLSPTLGWEAGDTPQPPQSFGACIAAALFGGGEGASRAARLLSLLLQGNTAVQDRLLRVPVDCPGSEPQLLLPRVTALLAECCTPLRASNAGMDALPARHRLQMSLLLLLFAWLSDCPPAVAAFLARPGHFPMLVELAQPQSADPLVSGLAVALLGCCLLFNDGSGGWDAHTVLDAVVSRLSLTTFFSAWEGLVALPQLRAAQHPSLPPPVTRASAAAALDGGAVAGQPCDACEVTAQLAARLVELGGRVRGRVTELYARPRHGSPGPSLGAAVVGESPASHAARLAALLAANEAELGEQRCRNAALAAQLLQGTGNAGDSASAALASMQHEAERSIAAARAEAEEARQVARQHEESLRSLGLAYNALEAEYHLLKKETEEAPQGDNGGGDDGTELTDLLVCLGQEEAKVERLRGLLLSYGHAVPNDL